MLLFFLSWSNFDATAKRILLIDNAQKLSNCFHSWHHLKVARILLPVSNFDRTEQIVAKNFYAEMVMRERQQY